MKAEVVPKLGFSHSESTISSLSASGPATSIWSDDLRNLLGECKVKERRRSTI